ncbi:MAG: DEAD/DEAH box helicase [Proteobacteria bacterium]|nr:DEAD/DEAH box helicase [Pseudomonadota bacterium]
MNIKRPKGASSAFQGVDSLQLAELVKEQYVRYFESEFPIKDQNLRAALHSFIRSSKSPIFRGPYIQVSQNLGEAKKKVDYGLDSRLLSRLPFERPYIHQGLAWERIASGKPNTILASGTGSGKTEALLVPLLNDLLRNPKAGLRAILVYPMNALLNDQLFRLNGREGEVGLLDPKWGITARDYTGSTAREDRVAMQDEKTPNIILTNYKMLELMLLRGELQKMFAQNPGSLSWLFYDELHTYIGVKGAEVAYLNRRLKSAAGLSDGMLKCIAASATAGEGEEATRSLTQFAIKFFGEEFSVDSVIGLPQKKGGYPLAIQGEVSQQKLGDTEFRKSVENRLAYAFSEPRTVESALPFWTEKDEARIGQPDQVNMTELSQSLTNLWPNGKPLSGNQLEHRVHLFLRGFIAVEHSIENTNWNFETTEAQKRPLFPVALCRECGEAGYLVRLVPGFEGSNTCRVEPNVGIDANKDPYAAWLTPEEPEGEKGQKTLTINWSDELKAYVTSEEAQSGISLFCTEVSADKERVKGFTKCPFCDAQNNQGEQIRRIASGTASNVTVLTASIMQHLPRERQKLIAFADSRQDVALQSGFTNQRSYRLTIGALISDYVARQPNRRSSINFRFRDFFDSTANCIPSSLIPDFELDLRKISTWLILANSPLRSRRITEWAGDRLDTQINSNPMKELEDSFNFEKRDLLTINSAYSMSPESNGFICVDYQGKNGMSLQEACTEVGSKIGLTTGETKVLVRWLLDRMRRIDLDCRVTVKTGELRQGREGRQKKKPAFGLLGKSAIPTAFARYLDGLLDSRISRTDLQGFAERLIQEMVGVGLLARESDGFRLATERMQLSVDLILYQCSHCKVRRSYPAGFFETDTRCAMARCRQGRLKPMDQESLDGLFYRQMGLMSKRFEAVHAAEHSAWIPEERRALIEKSFNSPTTLLGQVNVIVSSPTLEMGVDLKRTPAVVMRNVPPLVSSYKQRAGRAGRDTKSALIVTHTKPSPYDRFYYEFPERMINGHIHHLTMPIENELILSRHIHSYLLWSQDGKIINCLKSWRSLFFDDIESDSCDIIGQEPQVDRAYSRLINPFKERSKAELDSIFRVFKGADRSLIEIATLKACDSLKFALEMKWLPHFKDLQRDFHAAVNDMASGRQDSEKRMKTLRGLLHKHLGYRSTREGTKLSAWSPLFYLSDIGFLPRYEFPGETLTLRCMPNRTEESFEAQEDLFRALYDYAPGRNRQIWALGHKYKPRFFRSSTELLESRFICETHGFIGNAPEVRCPSCHGGKAFPVLSPTRIDADTEDGIDDSADERTSKGVIAKHFLSAKDPNLKDKTLPLCDSLPEECRFSASGSAALLYKKQEITITRIVASGYDSGSLRGFEWCGYCANLRKATKAAVDVADLGHSKACLEATNGNREINNTLLFGQKTNVSVIEIRLPRLDSSVLEGKSEEEAYQSLLQALLHSGRQICELGPRGEGLSGDILSDGSPFLIIYDPVPGGAGTIPYLWDKANEWFKSAYGRVCDLGESEGLGCDCSTACDRCLLDYTNQRFHHSLSRRLAAILLKHLRQSSVNFWGETVAGHSVDRIELGTDPVMWDPNSPLEKYFAQIASGLFKVRGSQLRAQAIAIPNTVTPDYKAMQSGKFLFLDSKQHHFQKWGDLVSDCGKRNLMTSTGMCWAPITNRMVRSDWQLISQIFAWAQVEHQMPFRFEKFTPEVPTNSKTVIKLLPSALDRLSKLLDDIGSDLTYNEVRLGYLANQAQIFSDFNSGRGDGVLLSSLSPEGRVRIIHFIVEQRGDFERYFREILNSVLSGFEVYLLPVSESNVFKFESVLNQTESRE